MKKTLSLLLVLVIFALSSPTTVAAREVPSVAPLETLASITLPEHGSVLPSEQSLRACRSEKIADTQSISSDALSDVQYYFVPFSETDAAAQEIADSAVYRLATLDDGKQTVYIAIDLEQGRNLRLLNNSVLRKASENLLAKSLEAVTEDADDCRLMDYVHIVGETKLHLVGYLISRDLGGENGLLSSVYSRCRVVTLNVEESRFASLIRVFGYLYGGLGG